MLKKNNIIVLMGNFNLNKKILAFIKNKTGLK
jgi:hypothetical protein